MIAFVFPGQNSHFVGMGRELRDTGGPAESVFETARSVIGVDLLDVMFDGPEDALTRTDNQQPAIATHSLAALSVLRESGLSADYVAGHSLGEYSALACAGCLRPEQVLRLVRFRGELMARAGDEAPGAMAAVLGLDADAVAAAVDEAGEEGVVVVANYNSPGQIVISGEPSAVERAVDLAGEAGAKGVITLDVSGAFHSPLMAAAVEPLIDRLEQTDFAPASLPVVANVDARPHTDPDELRDCLARQMTSSVLWQQSVRWMVDQGVDTFVEIGPGTVLSRLIRRIDRDLTVHNAGSPQEIETVVAELA